MQVDVNVNLTEHHGVSIYAEEQKYRGDAEVKRAPVVLRKLIKELICQNVSTVLKLSGHLGTEDDHMTPLRQNGG